MRQLPSFFALRAFECAARHESFTLAAVELHLTTSAISHQVRALETWLEMPLFLRQTRRVTLTPSGTRLLESLTSGFDLIEKACHDLRVRDQTRALSVHCAPSFASKWLSPRLGQFMQAHPDITSHVSSGAEPAELHRDGTLDLDIAYGAPPPRHGTVVESLGREAIVPMCSPRLIEQGPPVVPADLIRFTLIDSKLNPVQWSDWCRANGVELPHRARPSFDRGSLAIAAAVDGLGVALETRRFAELELAKGTLVVIGGPAFTSIERDTHFFCYRRADRDCQRMTVFRDWLYAQANVARPDGLQAKTQPSDASASAEHAKHAER